MLRRFVLIYPALLALAMGAHQLAATTLPTVTAMLLTSGFIAPIAALSARFDNSRFQVFNAVGAQFIAHFSLELLGGMTALDRAAGPGAHHSGTHMHAESLTHTVDSAHLHTDWRMTLMHVCSAVVLTMVLRRIDRFLDYIQQRVHLLVHVLTIVLHVLPSAQRRPAHIPHVHRLLVFLQSVSRRGPPFPVCF
ncbi:hypothetical protein [Timonella sp. A28]|uniref:hypothetical protein n=1 Tax=Timonella sp. A28 TaxID=3442640 RepID=UPI003EBA8306